ncbi:hypothetical protein D9V32_00260 [Mycetocola tolaasinivorans]|uniref:Uncharacterized protein n=1 Tax=Mycetocola tolaasinivorans TaxID=76635 RepID=A0A3L7ACU7_9MICO|nr:hypothetical protein [Mycetocola tolaasinivorans]RLP77804.1 hypothetical protein D9V32_00260 [Mycetocola tolaasinivorans]
MKKNTRFGSAVSRSVALALAGTVIAGAGISAAAAPAMAAPAKADTSDLGPAYSGAVRTYGVYAAADVLFGVVSARANISEAVAVADSHGLKPYAGVGADMYGVPYRVWSDANSRSYARSAPLGIGALGLPIIPIQSESKSGVLGDGGRKASPVGELSLGAIGALNLLSGDADSSWRVAQKGGVLAEANQTIGTLDLLPKSTLPELPLILPLVGADLGQTSAKVELTTQALTGKEDQLQVNSTATWTFADVQILGDLLRASWSGSRDTVPTLTASASGLFGQAKVDIPNMPMMQIRVLGIPVTITPNATIDLDAILPYEVSRIISGSISYGGITNVYEDPYGTEARGTMNGLNASLRILKVLPWLPPLGNAELGFMRADVSAKMQAGGVTTQDMQAIVDGYPVDGTNAGSGVVPRKTEAPADLPFLAPKSSTPAVTTPAPKPSAPAVTPSAPAKTPAPAFTPPPLNGKNTVKAPTVKK